eukprot:TRINITY_DN45678_c0_g1_i1.p1 TRINITY_DN45678_c0_g1~~TRINITY_DN45678_c0_g1_i1.p1  ORF type:complete len:433 (+),score=32.91 TRINITY_DN45678_c0_g1_i1:61-1359(+)
MYSAEALLYRKFVDIGLFCLIASLASFDLGVGLYQWGLCKRGVRDLNTLKEVAVERFVSLTTKMRWIGMLWFLPFLWFMEALQRLALRRSWSFLYRLVKGTLFVVKATRPEYYCIWLFLYVEGKAFRCHHLRQCAWKPHDVINVFMLALPQCFFTYAINDYYDTASDLLNPARDHKCYKIGPVQLMEGYTLDVAKYEEYQTLYLWARNCSFVLLCVWVAYYMFIFPNGLTNALIIVVQALLSCLYNVPPLRLKERPPIDLMLNALGYPLIYMFGISNPFQLVKFLPYQGVAPALALRYVIIARNVGLMQLVNNIKDYEADKQAGHKTFLVVYGSVGVLVYVCLCLLFQLWLAYMFKFKPGIFASMSALAASVILICVEKLTSQRLFRAYYSIPHQLRLQAMYLAFACLQVKVHYVSIPSRIVDFRYFWLHSP